mgnify:CR=1 FL=1
MSCGYKDQWPKAVWCIGDDPPIGMHVENYLDIEEGSRCLIRGVVVGRVRDSDYPATPGLWIIKLDVPWPGGIGPNGWEKIYEQATNPLQLRPVEKERSNGNT